ncbi:MAG: hypothetical protein ACODAA_08785 [Gemmatimonadota bacterium]
MTVSPAEQWAGGTVQASSEVFGAVPFAVVLAGDTLDVAATGEGTADIFLPNPHVTGPATLELFVDGAQVADATVQIVGAAREPRTVECDASVPPPCLPRLAVFYYGVGLPTGRLLAYVQLIADDPGAGFGFVQLDRDPPAVTLIPGLELDLQDAAFPALRAPGTADDADTWLLEASEPDSTAPPVRWTFPPLGATPQDTLDCLGDGMEGNYIVAELASGDCLVLDRSSSSEPARFTINGTTVVPGYGTVASSWRPGGAAFRAAVGGEWVTVRGADLIRSPAGVPPAWPVFSSDGTVAFSSDRYPQWPRGADFTPGADTLWVVGETTEGDWTLDAWDLGSGQMIHEFALDAAEACWDVRVDIEEPRLYIACDLADLPAEADEDWPSLLVYDRRAGVFEAVLHAPLQAVDWPAREPFELVQNVEEGTVHLTAVWDGTTAPVERGMMVASWNLF